MVQQSLVHDVVEVCEKVCVWGNILPPLHDPADQFIGMKLPLLVTLCQHGGLVENAHTHKHIYMCTKNSIQRSFAVRQEDLHKEASCVCAELVCSKLISIVTQSIKGR